MRLKNPLSFYVTENYYYPEKGPTEEEVQVVMIEETDILREYNTHLCTCQEKTKEL